MADRVIKDPAHPDFPHGKILGYRRGCKCEPCLKALRRYKKINKNQRVKVLRGELEDIYKPVEPIASYVEELGTLGFSTTKIARLAGVTPDSIVNIRARRYKTVRTPIANAILAISCDDRDRVPTAVIKALIIKLKKRGYTELWLSLACGKNRNYCNDVLRAVYGPKTKTLSLDTKRVFDVLKHIDELTQSGYLVPVKGRGVRTADLNAKAS